MAVTTAPLQKLSKASRWDQNCFSVDTKVGACLVYRYIIRSNRFGYHKLRDYSKQRYKWSSPDKRRGLQSRDVTDGTEKQRRSRRCTIC